MVEDEKLQALGKVFARFAKEAYRGTSPLYEALARSVSEDIYMLGVASAARQPPVPNLLFAAVHYLLLGGSTDALSSYYPSLTRAHVPQARRIRTSVSSASPTRPRFAV